MEELSYSAFILFTKSYSAPYMYNVTSDKQDDYILVSISEVVQFFNDKYPYQIIKVSECLNLSQHFVYIVEEAKIERVYNKLEFDGVKNSFDNLWNDIKKQLSKRGEDEIQ